MTDFSQKLNKLSPEKRRYALDTLPGHLVNTAQTAGLYQLLTDFDFMQAKLAECGVKALIEDYNLAMSADVLLNPEQTETLQLIAGTLRLSAHILASDTTKLAEQLLGRLQSFENPEIVALLEQAKQAQKKPWFRPLTANLTPPGGPLIRTFAGHSDSVYAVAITPDGKQAVSASRDNTLKLWDLATGEVFVTFTGEAAMVSCAIAPDGVTVVAGDSSGVVHFLRLEGLRGQET